jgi:hypothetical protein
MHALRSGLLILVSFSSAQAVAATLVTSRGRVQDHHNSFFSLFSRVRRLASATMSGAAEGVGVGGAVASAGFALKVRQPTGAGQLLQRLRNEPLSSMMDGRSGGTWISVRRAVAGYFPQSLCELQSLS